LSLLHWRLLRCFLIPWRHDENSRNAVCCLSNSKS
jgi:hypothetical protein